MRADARILPREDQTPNLVSDECYELSTGNARLMDDKEGPVELHVMRQNVQQFVVGLVRAEQA